MVKIATIFVAALAAFAPIAEAKDRNCVKGLTYCGYVLLRRGNYYDRIDMEVRRNHQRSDVNKNVNHSLFYCKGGSKGAIELKKICDNGCRDGGDGHSDTCIMT